ncbi:MAG: glycosyltransferase family 39 protein [Sedimentisphaerales bacterium]|nr:glycosyltransferase family 39 protein [Sedimentisphaerales bacterium]
MTQSPPKDISTETATRYERLFIAIICLIAGARIFIFSAALPFFTNVDEISHFDLVYKYSQGRLPAAPLEKCDPNAVRIIIHNTTGEYYDLPTYRSPQWLAESTSFLCNSNNRETWAWPSYYLLAGLWCRLGISLGLGDGQLLYWIRFLNVPLMAVLVWVSYLVAVRVFPENRHCRLSLPILVAFFPQDIFFYITGDALSPPAFTAAFMMLLSIYLSEKSLRYHLIAGFVVAVTFLTKVSNIAIVALAVVVMLLKIKQAVSQGQFKNYLPCLTVFVAAAAIPVAIWLGRNYILFGDIIGSAAVFNERGWEVKPLAQIFAHPIFGGRGLFTFLTELTKTFWRGEVIWRDKRMALPFADFFYVITSAVFFIACLARLILNKSEKPLTIALKMSFFVVSVSILFLAFASMRFEFGEFVYPSCEYPYFTSGRLIAGTIVPFLVLYIAGLHYILSKFRLASRLLVIVVIIAAVITISEIILTWPVFSSPYNWFHLK